MEIEVTPPAHPCSLGKVSWRGFVIPTVCPRGGRVEAVSVTDGHRPPLQSIERNGRTHLISGQRGIRLVHRVK